MDAPEFTVFGQDASRLEELVPGGGGVLRGSLMERRIGHHQIDWFVPPPSSRRCVARSRSPVGFRGLPGRVGRAPGDVDRAHPDGASRQQGGQDAAAAAQVDRGRGVRQPSEAS